MILSVSRRTDIPAFYSEWFFNRLINKEVLVKNPMNRKVVSRISLEKNLVDCIVFWTKDVRPMLNRLEELNGYKYYFQYTITPYGKDLEPNVPTKNNEIIESFIELAKLIGNNKVIWRYDPILISDKYTIEYHTKYFEMLAKRFEGSTKQCVISFVDIYRKNKKKSIDLRFRELSSEEVFEIASKFSQIAKKYDMKLKTCSEGFDLSGLDITHSSCIDKELVEEIIGAPISHKKDANQRLECECIESVDIGSYNTCMHFCQYCYANYDSKTVYINNQKHDKNSGLLFGELDGDEKIVDRKVKSIVRNQTQLF